MRALKRCLSHGRTAGRANTVAVPRGVLQGLIGQPASHRSRSARLQQPRRFAPLRASRRDTASSAGVSLFQAMRKWAQGKSVPAALVNLVLTFAAGRPSLLQALEGRVGELPSLGHWWEESGHREHQDSESARPDATSHVQAERLAVAERQPAGAAPSSSNEAQARPDSTSRKAGLIRARTISSWPSATARATVHH